MKASYTMYDTFSTCPHQHYRLYLDKTDKVKRATSDALEKGIRIHEGIEKWMLDESTVLPEEVHGSWRPMMLEIKDQAPEVEAFLQNDIALGKLDAYKPGEYTLDWKSGKPRVSDPGKREQLRFYAWLAKEDLKASLCWVEHPFEKSMVTIDIKYTQILDSVWRNRIEKMFDNDGQTKTKSWKCNWCPVEDCEFFKNWKKGP